MHARRTHPLIGILTGCAAVFLALPPLTAQGQSLTVRKARLPRNRFLKVGAPTSYGAAPQDNPTVASGFGVPVHNRGGRNRQISVQPGKPILYSTINGYIDVSSFDLLYPFPITGYDPTVFTYYGVDYSSDEDYTFSDDSRAKANVAYAQVGQPCAITHLVVIMGLENVNNFLPAGGKVAIQFYDGVDATHPPSAANLAKTAQGNTSATYDWVADPFNDAQIFTFKFGNGDVTGANANPFLIKDPRGRFGVKLTKVSETDSTHTHPENQVVWYYNAPNGPNMNYVLTPNSGGTRDALRTYLPSRADYNQSFADEAHDDFTMPYNLLFEVHGNALTKTNPVTYGPYSAGIVQGNLRNRGVDLPLDENQVATVESKPRKYRLTAYEGGTRNIVRQDDFFSQPSYDDLGHLTINYKITGYPVGTYDLEITQLPIFRSGDPLDVNNTDRDVLWDDTTRWPFGDYQPLASQFISVLDADPGDYRFNPPIQPSGFPTDLTGRLEHFADLDNGSGVGTLDGVVGLEDLVAFFDAYGYSVGDRHFNPLADLLGGVDPNTNPQGVPDGIVDLEDLVAFFTEYGQGSYEP